MTCIYPARIISAYLAALRPVLRALWREKCIEVGIFSDECWITSSEAEIIDILRTSNAEARSLPGPTHYHRFETYDFDNLPDAALQEVMLKLLESTFRLRSQHGLRSIELHWGFADDYTSPAAHEVSWSYKQPHPITTTSKSRVWVGPDKIFRWLKCVLNQGFVQFGPHIYRQTSGVFMGTFPAPELTNDFAFWLECVCCVCVFSSHLFWTSSSLGVPAEVTQEENHTGFLIHLPSAVHAFIFLARRTQPFLFLVHCEVGFCELPI